MTRRGLVLFLAMCVIWGIPYLLIRVAVSEVSPAVLVFLRTGLATLILAPLVFARGGPRTIGSRWRWLLAFAAVEIGVPWFFLSSAERQITSALAALLIAAVPLVGAVIAAAFGNREHFGLVSLTGLLLGLAGVVLIVGFDLRASNAVAVMEMGVVVVGYALGPAILARYLTGIPSVTVIGSALALCCVVYAPFALATWPAHLPSVAAMVALGGLAVVCTAVAFLLFFALIDEVGPVRSTVITYVNPAVAAIAGFAVLRESLTLAMVAGFALVIAGSVLSTRRPGVAEPRREVAEQPLG